MNVTIFAFGRTGCRIADKLKYYDTRQKESIINDINAYDTASKQLSTLDRISDDDKQIFGVNEFDKKGSPGFINDVLPHMQKLRGKIMQQAQGLSRVADNAILVIGSLGGGTGSAAMPRAAKVIRQAVGNTPVYGIAVLPHSSETGVYTLNAAKSIQSLSKETDTVILFDNDNFTISLPSKYTNNTLDETYAKVNNHIARQVHLVFSADEDKRGKHGLDDTLIDTGDIINTLGTGGLTTLSYNSYGIPKAAKGGVVGFVHEMGSSISTYTKAKLHSVREFGESTTAKATGGNEESGDGDEETAMKLADNVETTDMSKYKREWAIPSDLLPYSLHRENLSMDCNPKDGVKRLCLLIGPAKQLSEQQCVESTKWIQKHTNADETIVGNYPKRADKIAVLTVNSGVGIPQRLREQQEAALNVRREILNEDRKLTAKSIDVFDELDAVVPAV